MNNLKAEDRNMESIIPTNKNKYLVVKNLHGTTGLKCECSSWYEHWKKGSRSIRTECAVSGCHSDAVVGAHVISTDNRMNRQWWIAPFCYYHNNYHFNKEVALDKNVTLISANRSITCSKRGWLDK